MAIKKTISYLIFIFCIFFENSSQSAQQKDTRTINREYCDFIYKNLNLGTQDIIKRKLYGSFWVNSLEINERDYTFATDYFYSYGYYDNDLVEILKNLVKIRPNILLSERLNSAGTSWPLCKYDLKKSIEDKKFKNFSIEANVKDEKIKNSEIWIYAHGFIKYEIESTALWTNSYDLKKFPFDEHLILFGFHSSFKDFISFTPNSEKEDEDHLKTANIPGWNIKKVDVYAGTKKYSNTFYATLDIQRTYASYIIKFFIPIFFIVCISFSCLWITEKDLKTRVELSIVCLLSLIAFNFVITGKLPDLPYITFLDSFVLLSYFFAGMTTIMTIIIFNVPNKKLKDRRNITLNQECKVWLPSAYLISNIATWAYLWNKL